MTHIASGCTRLPDSLCLFSIFSSALREASPDKSAVSASPLPIQDGPQLQQRQTTEQTANLTPGALQAKQTGHASVQLACYLGIKYRVEAMDHR